jgi:hypothetical protein
MNGTILSNVIKFHSLKGTVVIDTTGAFLESTIEETYTGPATTCTLYKFQSNKDSD